jgi:hypothetical protein
MTSQVLAQNPGTYVIDWGSVGPTSSGGGQGWSAIVNGSFDVVVMESEIRLESVSIDHACEQCDVFFRCHISFTSPAEKSHNLGAAIF